MGSEEGMQCPLTSAKQFLRGPRFTKQAYVAARATAQVDTWQPPSTAEPPSADVPSTPLAPTSEPPSVAGSKGDGSDTTSKVAKVTSGGYEVRAEVSGSLLTSLLSGVIESCLANGATTEEEVKATLAMLSRERKAAGGSPTADSSVTSAKTTEDKEWGV
jgi:hypothetical protein